MVWIGALIVFGAFYAIIRHYDTKLVLLGSGALMAILSGNLPTAVDAFIKSMVHDSLVPIICTVMGFAYVMKITKCDLHLVKWILGGVKQGSVLLIPAAVLITALLANALPSASGASAAVGSILIPALIRAGVHPAIAGSTIVAGVWGGSLTPGSTQHNIVAKMADVDIMTLIGGVTTAVVAGIIITAIGITAVAIWRKEHSGYVLPLREGEHSESADLDAADFKLNYLKALLPLVPLTVLILSSKQLHVLPYIPVPHAMLLGSVFGLAAEWRKAANVSNAFFDGMGHAFSGIIGIVIAAAVFTTGMQLIGLTTALVEVMKHSEYIARFAAAFGPFIIALLSGSGDAAILAFNTSVTPYAEHFGFTILDMGTTATLGGVIGRSLSPVSGCAIVCAQLAGVSTMELTKRNLLGLISAAIAVMLIQMP